MTIIRSPSRMQAVSRRLRERGKRIGVVPTMGALHEGHLSLVRKAVLENDCVIVTIFVNPTQFGPHEDYLRYPRPFAQDARLVRRAGAHIIFAPSAKDMYPRGFQTYVEVGAIAANWEGACRPGHFRGVASVVAMLFQVTSPTKAYFGQKDYQQSLVVRQMVRDLRLPVRIRVLPTVREADGLAASSRNLYLKAAERRKAAILYRTLEGARTRIRAGERRTTALVARMKRELQAEPGLDLDYAVAVDARTLLTHKRLRGRVAVLLAVRVGRTRLIDNILVDVS